MPAVLGTIRATLRRSPIFVKLRRAFEGIWRRRIRRLTWKITAAVSSQSSLRWGGPTTGLLLYQSLKRNEPGLEGQIVLHGQKPSRLPVNSMQEQCGLRQHEEQPWPIFWTRHQHARLVTTALALELPGKRLAMESVYFKRNLLDFDETSGQWSRPLSLEELSRTTLCFDEVCLYGRLPPPVKLSGNYTSIVSGWTPTEGVPNFSHWFLDALPRLALLKEFPPDTRILVPGRLAEYQRESLRMLGLLDRVRFTSETNLIVENYYFSSPVSMVVCDSPYSVDFLRANILPHASKTYSGPRRFIIDREGAFRAIANRDEFNRFFEKLGWSIMKPEDLSLADEIKLFADAEAICGILGSGFTNTIWCAPGCKVIQILPETLLDGSTEWICMHNQLEWRYLICQGDMQFNATVNLNKLRDLLRELKLV